MADYYHRRHVRELLKYRKILFLGDSNIRPLYKDLLSAIRKRDLPKAELLSGTESMSYCDDKLLQQSGSPNDWKSWEHRLYEKQYFQVELFFMGRVAKTAVDYFVERLHFASRSLPNVVYMSFSPRLLSGENNNSNRESLLVNFLGKVKASLPINTMFILGSGFEVVKDFFGNPCFEEIPFLLNCSSWDSNDDTTIKKIASSLGFHVLNVAYYHQRDVFRGMTSHPGWQIVVVRYTTCLLLTYIAMNLSLKHPKKVAQDTLRKAIAETQADNEVYRRLLLQLPLDWEGAKHISPEALNDPAGDNARELVCILWAQLQRSSTRGKSTTEKPNRKKVEREKNKTHSNLKGKAEQEKQTDDLADDFYEAVSSSSSARSSPKDFNLQDFRSSPVASDFTTTSVEGTVSDNAEPDRHHDDDLEEGEIREPSPIKNQLSTVLDDVSDIDSSESSYSDGETSELARFPERSQIENFVPRTYPQSGCPWLSEMHNPEMNFTSQPDIPVESCVPNDLIEISDEELPRDDGVSEVPLSIIPGACLISSDESDVEPITDSNCPYSRPSARNRSSASSAAKPTREKTSGLVLVDRREKVVPWPINVADSGIEKLWRWWKNYLSDNKGVLTIRCPGTPDIHAKTPRLHVPRGEYLVLPKIVDDLAEFLKNVQSIPFHTEPLEDSSIPDGNDSFQNNSKTDETPTSESTMEDPPSQSREKLESTVPLHRKIAFTFSQKRSASDSSAEVPNKIRVRSFAAISNIVGYSHSQKRGKVCKRKTTEPSPSPSRTFGRIPTTHSSYSPFGPWISSVNKPKPEGKARSSSPNERITRQASRATECHPRKSSFSCRDT